MTRQCPDCGEQLPLEAAQADSLAHLGYLHTDVHVSCEACGRRVSFGVPVDRKTDQEPRCDVCGGRGYPYKVDGHLGWPDLDVHWKCEDCYYRWNGEVDHLTGDVYSLGVTHLEGRAEDA